MDTYFSSRPSSSEELLHFHLEYQGERFPWISAAGVFQRRGLDVGTRLLLDCAVEVPGEHVLDLGCGHGPLGLLDLRRRPGARGCLVDVNERACRVSRLNARSLDLPVQVVQADVATCLRSGSFDLVLTNPPIRAGLAVLDRFWQESARVLVPGGSLVFVGRPKQGGRRLAARAAEALGVEHAEKLGRNKGFEVFRVIRGS